MSRLFSKLRNPSRNTSAPEPIAAPGSPAAVPEHGFPIGIKQLYPPNDAAADDAIVDICFVHGLMGDRERTWTAKGLAEPWPKTLLPTVLPQARILTFGYDAYIVSMGPASTSGLRDHATSLLHHLTLDREKRHATARPLIFVAHSLGGLICKTALVVSRDSPEEQEHLRHVFYSIVGIAFMGTPHRGSLMADWASAPAAVLGAFKSNNTKLLRVLRTDSESLETIHSPFVNMIKDPKPDGRVIKVACFCEELGSPVVVPKQSAIIDGIEPIMIRANHRDMVRFASVHDHGFDLLLGELKRWIRTISPLKPLKTMLTAPAISETCQDCLASLRFNHMDMRFSTISRATIKTCEWLLGHPKYEQWATDGRGLFWITGKPGSGKSTLLKFAYEHCPQGEDTNGLVLNFFFHDRGGALQKTPLGFFRSVAHQVLHAAPTTDADLVRAYRQNHPQQRDAPINEWAWEEQELQDYVALALPKILATRPVWLYVDALDEAGEKNAVALFAWLAGLLSAVSGSPFPCRFCVSCRQYPIVAPEDFAFQICTQDENVKDIAAYVDGRLAHAHAAGEIRSSDIPRLIIERAAGNFLWTKWVVERVLDASRDGNNLRAVRDVVKGTPNELRELYAKQVAAMDGDADCLRLLEWVCFGDRPLSLDELRWAMAVAPDCEHESLQDCAPDVLDRERMKLRVRALSRGLVEITSSSKVQFIHQSVKEYMLDMGLSAFHSGSVPAAEDTRAEARRVAHLHLAKTCIRYLAMKEISQQILRENLSFFPLLRYATNKWVAHAKGCDSDSGIHVSDDEDLLNLLQWPSGGLVVRWAHLRWLVNGYITYLTDWTALEQVFAAYGIAGLLRAMMRRDTQVNLNTRNKVGRTLLLLAVEGKHEAVVRLLLETDTGVNVNQASDSGETPLLRAVANGHEAVVRLLLEIGTGANVNQATNKGWTPLLSAIWRGHEAVVRLLLGTGTGVDVNQADDGGWTPLSMAAWRGHEAVARLLIKNGAAINHTTNIGWTPLLQAVGEGHEAVARLLVENGAAVNQASNLGQTPLLQAVRLGHGAMARLLVNKGADVSHVDELGWTPLLRAACLEHEAVARLLIENGADVNQADELGQTPLSLAVGGGHEAVVRLLLKPGVGAEADVNRLDHEGWTALSVAAREGSEVLARLLIAKGAAVNQADNKGRTPLSLAAGRGHGAVARLLIENGAAIDQADNVGRTPMSVAVAGGCKAVVRLLREYGGRLEEEEPQGSHDDTTRRSDESRPDLKAL